MNDAPLCPNCATPRLGPYCQECGQKAAGRLTLKGFFQTGFARAFSMDRGYLRTFVGLMKRPGEVAREYVDGRRARYTNPLTYWLIAATFQLIALWLVNDIYHEALQESIRMPMEQQADGGAAALERYKVAFGSDDPVPVIASILVKAMRAAYSYLGVFFALALAFFLNLFLRKKSGGENLAEQLVFALYMIGHWALLTAFILPFSIRISTTLHGVIGIIGYFVIVFVGSLQFHQRGYKAALASGLSLLLAFLIYLVAMLIVMVGYMIAGSQLF